MMIKNYLKCYGYLFGMIIVMTLILSLINYFVKIPSTVIKILIPIISLFISSVFLGKSIQEKGYILILTAGRTHFTTWKRAIG